MPEIQRGLEAILIVEGVAHRLTAILPSYVNQMVTPIGGDGLFLTINRAFRIRVLRTG